MSVCMFRCHIEYSWRTRRDKKTHFQNYDSWLLMLRSFFLYLIWPSLAMVKSWLFDLQDDNNLLNSLVVNQHQQTLRLWVLILTILVIARKISLNWQRKHKCQVCVCVCAIFQHKKLWWNEYSKKKGENKTDQNWNNTNKAIAIGLAHIQSLNSEQFDIWASPWFEEKNTRALNDRFSYIILFWNCDFASIWMIELDIICNWTI